MRKSTAVRVLVALATMLTILGSGPAGAEPPDRAAAVVDHWTPERMADAVPRDLFLDHRGFAYLRSTDGLEPYGHQVAATAAPLRAVPLPRKPGGGGGGGGGSGDTTPPDVTGMSPTAGQTIGASHTFSAVITDQSGIKSVQFDVQSLPNGLIQTFRPSNVGGDTWAVTLEGFTDGSWQWRVRAKDGAGRGGNTSTTGWVEFTVELSGPNPPPPPPPDGIITDADWTGMGKVATAAGRIYFEMPGNAMRKGPWSGYVCSGTVMADGTDDRSVIITAAHCVYDDVNKAFARNVLFIPQQQNTTASGTDLNCNNDPIGCWAPSMGVVDIDWTTRTFPDNIPWDFAYYVVDDAGSHQGAGSAGPLDGAVPPLDVPFTGHALGQSADAIGYSYSQDPRLRYCSEPLATESAYGDLWLGSCGLSGGSSGGPWLQPSGDGNGPIISVNSWGYTNQPGMAGPVLDGEASCLFGAATTADLPSAGTADGDEGSVSDCF